MEVWILLAAAGSGYLARRWQNAQKPKGSSADEAEDGAGPSQNMPSSRGRYRHFSSSGKLQVGKSICGKGSPYWARPKSTGNLVEYRTGNKVMGGEGDKKLNREGHTCNDANGCQICLDSRDVNHAHDGSGVHVDSNEHETTSPDEAPSDSLPRKRISISGPSDSQIGKQDRYELERVTKEEDGKGQPSGESSHPILFRSMSGKRANDSFEGKTRPGGQMPQDGCAGKRMKDALDSSSTANQSEGCVFGSWMPGFWDVSEGVFVLDSESLLVQQGERNRGSSSRKSKTPNKYGRSKGSRKRSLAGQKPMSSLESCLSAQLDEDYIRRQFTGTRQIEDEVRRDSGKISSRCPALLASEGKASLSKTEFAIGLPSISRLPSSKRFPSKSRTPRPSFDGTAMIKEPFNPFACRRYESASGTKGGSKKGMVVFLIFFSCVMVENTWFV
ncbi:hypothetical protein L7F22_048560 [Adiantum nelumboides]|nr:hypothetical protein [Adiantum nelumboides]